jgi:meckelin
MDLLLFNILTFSACDIWLSNTAVSILLTFLLDRFIVYIRASFGERNIAAKTMVDERFLI